MTGTGHIRWEGPDSSGTLTGHTGTLSVWLFRIYRDGGKGWRLDCELPGWNGVPAYGHSPELLKGRAETWLTGFTASLGAVFPASACSRCDEPVTVPGDRQDRTWCSEECRDGDAEAAYEQTYRPGVAT